MGLEPVSTWYHEVSITKAAGCRAYVEKAIAKEEKNRDQQPTDAIPYTYMSRGGITYTYRRRETRDCSTIGCGAYRYRDLPVVPDRRNRGVHVKIVYPQSLTSYLPNYSIHVATYIFRPSVDIVPAPRQPMVIATAPALTVPPALPRRTPSPRRVLARIPARLRAAPGPAARAAPRRRLVPLRARPGCRARKRVEQAAQDAAGPAVTGSAARTLTRRALADASVAGGSAPPSGRIRVRVARASRRRARARRVVRRLRHELVSAKCGAQLLFRRLYATPSRPS